MSGRTPTSEASPLGRLARALRHWPGRRGPLVRLQPVALADADLQAARELLAELGAELGARFELVRADGDVVLMDLDFASREPQDVVRARAGARPAVLVERVAGAARSARKAELARQLAALPQLRARHAAQAPVDLAAAPASRLSTVFDAEPDAGPTLAEQLGRTPDAAQRALVGQVLRGLRDERTPVLLAGYGPGAALRADFGRWAVCIDPAALQALRVQHRLPLVDPAARPSDDAAELALDHFVWELGLASGPYVLLDQPADPWGTPLQPQAIDRVERYSGRTRHLELMRRLEGGPATPEALFRHVRIGTADLRRFLQACLFLGLLRWAAGIRR